MKTATDLGTLEKVLADTAQAKGVSVKVYSMNGSVHADVDSGHAGGITFKNDQYNENVLSGSAHSYIAGGNWCIRDALANAGIPSSLVDAGPECDAQQVQFIVKHDAFESAVNTLYTAFKKLELRGV